MPLRAHCGGLQTSSWGRTILFLIGFGLIVYGLYCMFVAFVARQFPTPGPTDVELAKLRRKRAEKEEKEALKKAEKARRREHGTEMSEVPPTASA